MSVAFRIVFLISAILIALIAAEGLTCFKGYKVLSGKSIEETETCSGSSAYCYNFTASTGFFIKGVKAGCSTFRCMFAKDKCIKTEFQGVPVSLCCCKHNHCNS